MAKPIFMHHEQRVAEGFVRVDGDRRARHHVRKPGDPRIEPSRNDANEHVAFGKNSDKVVVFDDQDRADTLAAINLAALLTTVSGAAVRGFRRMTFRTGSSNMDLQYSVIQGVWSVGLNRPWRRFS